MQNASPASTAMTARSELVRSFPSARIISVASRRNLGFAAGVNLGVSRTTAPLVGVFNPDGVTRPETVARLAARSNRMVTRSWPARSWCRRPYRTSRPHVLPDSLIGSRGPRRCIGASGCSKSAVSIPASSCIAKTSTFLGAARARGWRLVFVPDAVFLHARGFSRARITLPDSDVDRLEHEPRVPVRGSPTTSDGAAGSSTCRLVPRPCAPASRLDARGRAAGVGSLAAADSKARAPPAPPVGPSRVVGVAREIRSPGAHLRPPVNALTRRRGSQRRTSTAFPSIFSGTTSSMTACLQSARTWRSSSGAPSLVIEIRAGSASARVKSKPSSISWRTNTC